MRDSIIHTAIKKRITTVVLFIVAIFVFFTIPLVSNAQTVSGVSGDLVFSGLDDFGSSGLVIYQTSSETRLDTINAGNNETGITWSGSGQVTITSAFNPAEDLIIVFVNDNISNFNFTSKTNALSQNSPWVTLRQNFGFLKTASSCFNLGTETPCTAPVLGCTDPLANNYNSGANTEDGSCTYNPNGNSTTTGNTDEAVVFSHTYTIGDTIFNGYNPLSFLPNTTLFGIATQVYHANFFRNVGSTVSGIRKLYFNGCGDPFSQGGAIAVAYKVGGQKIVTTQLNNLDYCDPANPIDPTESFNPETFPYFFFDEPVTLVNGDRLWWRIDGYDVVEQNIAPTVPEVFGKEFGTGGFFSISNSMPTSEPARFNENIIIPYFVLTDGIAGGFSYNSDATIAYDKIADVITPTYDTTTSNAVDILVNFVSPSSFDNLPAFSTRIEIRDAITDAVEYSYQNDFEANSSVTYTYEETVDLTDGSKIITAFFIDGNNQLLSEIDEVFWNVNVNTYLQATGLTNPTESSAGLSQEDCTLYDVGCQFQRALIFLFKPTASGFNSLTQLGTNLSSRAPFSYYYDAREKLENLEDGEGTLANVTVTIPPLGNVTLVNWAEASSGFGGQQINMFSVYINYGLWFFFLVWAYRRTLDLWTPQS